MIYGKCEETRIVTDHYKRAVPDHWIIQTVGNVVVGRCSKQKKSDKSIWIVGNSVWVVVLGTNNFLSGIGIPENSLAKKVPGMKLFDALRH